jgi:hypothetical protein
MDVPSHMHTIPTLTLSSTRTHMRTHARTHALAGASARTCFTSAARTQRFRNSQSSTDWQNDFKGERTERLLAANASCKPALFRITIENSIVWSLDFTKSMFIPHLRMSTHELTTTDPLPLPSHHARVHMCACADVARLSRPFST